MIKKTRSEGFGPEVRRRILLGTYVLSAGYFDAYYKKAKLLQAKIRDDFRKAFQAATLYSRPLCLLPQ
jgi:aspartyl-tRNA(Asn)/glutamyl-tRNA(Gln) amidotransferase subunit A